MGLFNKSTEPCKCSCHHTETMSLHMMPCCNLTYEKYITGGVVDMKLWTELNEKSFIELMEQRAIRDKERLEELKKIKSTDSLQ